MNSPRDYGPALYKDPSKFSTPYVKTMQSPQGMGQTGIGGIAGGQRSKATSNIHPCYKFWQKFSRCYANAESDAACRLEYEDYRECYTKRKEIQRMKRISHQFETNLLASGKTRAEVRHLVKQGVVVSVNLIEAEMDLNELGKEKVEV